MQRRHFMRFSPLIVELIRARPRLVLWLAVLAQAVLWLLVAVLLYRSPPGDLPLLLAIGREYQVGTDLGPPLAFWLADAAFRIAGNHMIGIYLLSQICLAVTFAALFALGRRIVGGPHAALAVILTLTITAFGMPNLTFGPQVLACPLWALVLLHGWRVIGEGSRQAWFALSIAAGLLLLTTTAAPWLLALLIVFALASGAGRRSLSSLDPLFAALVVAVLVLPYLVWRARAGTLGLPAWPGVPDPGAIAPAWGRMAGSLLLTLAGMAVLILINTRFVHRTLLRGRDSAPAVVRRSVDPLARRFVYVFALAPPLLGSVVAVLSGDREVAAGPGVVLLMSGLAVVMVTGDVIYLRRQQVLRTVWGVAIAAPALVLFALALIQPWITGTQIPTSLSAGAMAQFFGDSFQRRTNRPLPAVVGDPQLGALIGLGPARPRVLLASPPGPGPWLTPAKFRETGGVVVWRASDTAGTPPPAIAQQFPGVVPEVPKGFDWLVNGRASPLRIGWAIVRPQVQ